MSRSARVLAPGEVRRVLTRARRSSAPHRNVVIVQLSFRAGLRACEIAGLTWQMVTKPDGKLSDLIEIDGTIAKNGQPRRLPMHPEIRSALVTLRAVTAGVSGPVVRSRRGSHMTPRSIVNWFAGVYHGLGFAGCSSHSGRRTFVTQAARLVAKTGGSLRDVQELAGHASLNMTARYVAGSTEAQRKLIRLLC